ncbi:MAG: 4-hydroxy-3-methylbut-2-enyl diphosphate reductase [Deltaproteobacteria bacterium]|nr:4-hydroxy-3-methylbut-2-enyl diphosphate reductase [Deltaproteobacteria bacterium]
MPHDTARTVILAKTAGFCMGVGLALRKLDKAVAESTGRIFTHGPIIHNPQVLARYESLGVRQLASDIQAGAGDTVVVRAHGIPLAEQKALEALGVRVVDATCPKVKKAQVLIAEQAAQGRTLLLFGEPEHPEVKGLVSYARGQSMIFDSVDGLREALAGRISGQCFFLAAQTTQARDMFGRVREVVLDLCGEETPILDTICDATKERQEEVVEIAAQVEAMVVVGGKNSGNTRRLAAVARESGVFCVHVETAGELAGALNPEYRVVGLAAGASTPGDIIEEVRQALLAS